MNELVPHTLSILVLAYTSDVRRVPRGEKSGLPGGITTVVMGARDGRGRMFLPNFSAEEEGAHPVILNPGVAI